MSLLEANHFPVASGRVHIPLIGASLAELRLAVPAEETPIQEGQAVTLAFETGETLETTCIRAGSDGAYWCIKVVGGKARMNTVLPPKYYQGIPISTVIRDLVGEAGEQIAEAGPDTVVTYYTRLEGPAWQLLGHALQESPDYSWRIHADGQLHIARWTWPDYPETLKVLESRPDRRRHVFPFTVGLQPGVRLKGSVGGVTVTLGHVELVTHWLGRQLRTEVWCV